MKKPVKIHSPRWVVMVLCILLLLGTLFNVSSQIFKYSNEYFSHDYWQRYPALKQTYLDSQYVNKHPKGWIPDEAVNAYAGGAYITGTSPILIAPDTPPLGRYIIGLSGLIFNNENILPLLLTLGSLVMLYLIGLQIFYKPVLALLAPFLVSLEPLYTNQIVFTPLLDTIQLFFLLCGFYFFNIGVKQNKKNLLFFSIASIFLGFFIATKFYATGVTIIAAWGITLLIIKRIKAFGLFILSIPIAVFVLLFSYVRVLFDHYTFFKFLGIQKYVLLYHKSQLILPFTIWPLLLFNKWYVWFGNNLVISDSQWRITWPIITLFSLATGFLLILKKIKFSVSLLPLLLWIFLYLLFFSVGQISARYLIILIPVMYVIAIYGLYEVFNIYYLAKHKKV